MYQPLYGIIMAAFSVEVEKMNHYIKQFIDSTRLELTNTDQDLSKKPIVSDLIQAAVLIPFTVWENELVILFTKRTDSVNNHQNQISFPGGAIEKRDADPLVAALRETKEEIGIKKKDIEILGELKPITGKHDLVFPSRQTWKKSMMLPWIF